MRFRSRFLPLFSPWITGHELQAVSQVLQGGLECDYTGQLESDIAQYVGSSEAIALSSPTTALSTVLAALNIGSGDEVILPAITSWATVRAASSTGARPVLCDVRDDLTLSPESAARLLSLRTKALVASHWGGQPCKISEIADLCRRSGIHLIEDASHALGGMEHSRFLGTFGIAGIYSFFPSDNFLTGEGAVVVTSDRQLAAKISFIVHRSSSDPSDPTDPSDRISGLQAALAVRQLEKQELFLELRTRYADAYLKAIADLPFAGPVLRPDCRPTWHLFTLTADWAELGISREEFLARLHSENIGCGVLVQIPAPNTQHLSNAERQTARMFSLPLFPRMIPADVNDVVAAVSRAIGR